jgi:hypothetical protein
MAKTAAVDPALLTLGLFDAFVRPKVLSVAGHLLDQLFPGVDEQATLVQVF